MVNCFPVWETVCISFVCSGPVWWSAFFKNLIAGVSHRGFAAVAGLPFEAAAFLGSGFPDFSGEGGGFLREVLLGSEKRLRDTTPEYSAGVEERVSLGVRSSSSESWVLGVMVSLSSWASLLSGGFGRPGKTRSSTRRCPIRERCFGQFLTTWSAVPQR